MRARSAIAMGCSAGGLLALERVLPGLDPRLPVLGVSRRHSGSPDVSLLCLLLRPLFPSPLPHSLALAVIPPRPLVALWIVNVDFSV